MRAIYCLERRIHRNYLTEQNQEIYMRAQAQSLAAVDGAVETLAFGCVACVFSYMGGTFLKLGLAAMVIYYILCKHPYAGGEIITKTFKKFRFDDAESSFLILFLWFFEVFLVILSVVGAYKFENKAVYFAVVLVGLFADVLVRMAYRKYLTSKIECEPYVSRGCTVKWDDLEVKLLPDQFLALRKTDLEASEEDAGENTDCIYSMSDDEAYPKGYKPTETVKISHGSEEIEIKAGKEDEAFMKIKKLNGAVKGSKYYLSSRAQEVYQWSLAHGRFALVYLVVSFVTLLMILLFSMGEVEVCFLSMFLVFCQGANYKINNMIVDNNTYFGNGNKGKASLAQATNILMVVVEYVAFMLNAFWIADATSGTVIDLLFVAVYVFIALAVCGLRLAFGKWCKSFIKDKAYIDGDTEAVIKTNSGEFSLPTDEVFALEWIQKSASKSMKAYIWNRKDLTGRPLKECEFEDATVIIKNSSEEKVITSENYEKYI